MWCAFRLKFSKWMRPYTFLILINFHWSLFHTCHLRLKKKRRSVMAQSIPSVPPPPPPPPPPGICHFVLEKLQLCHHGGAGRSYKYPRWGLKNRHIFKWNIEKTASRRIDPLPGQRFSDKFPTAGTDKMTNAQQMPRGEWARLELTELVLHG